MSETNDQQIKAAIQFFKILKIFGVEIFRIFKNERATDEKRKYE